MVVLAPISNPKREPRSQVTQRLPEILEHYLRYHRIEGSTDSTLIHKKKELGAFIKWLDSESHSLLPEDVATEDIEEHLAWMKGRGLAVGSLHTRLRSIKPWFKWMKKRERIPSDPSEVIGFPKLPKRRKPFMKQEQFDALLALCPLNRLLGARRQAMLWVMATTGIRRNELALLRVEDLDWDKEALTILHGKGQQERRAPFGKEAQKPMLHYFEQRELKGFDSEWLWVTEEGKPLTWHGVGQDLKRLHQRAGVSLKDVCHSMRRTRAAVLVREGVPRPYICETMGWAPESKMLDRYVADMAAEKGAIEAVKNIPAFGA